MPKVSVIIVCYDNSAGLEKALNSLQKQSFSDWEAIVVDDGSHDHPEAVIRKLRDDRIAFERLDQNSGRGLARQIGLDNSKGKYITFLDSDDELVSKKIELQVEYLEENSDVNFVSCQLLVQNPSLETLGCLKFGVTQTQKFEPIHRAFSSSPIPFAPTMFRSQLIQSLGFDTSLSECEDFDLLVRAHQIAKSAIICEPLYIYRVNPQSFTSAALRRSRITEKIILKRFSITKLSTLFALLKLKTKQLVYKSSLSARSTTPLERALSPVENSKQEVA